MKPITFIDDRCPVRTVYSDKADWEKNEGWRQSDIRKSLLQTFLGVPLERVFYAKQVHSGNVLAVSNGSGGDLDITEEKASIGPVDGFDALVTDVPGILLCIWTADCLPLFLCDPVRKVAAIAHCGWRGICNGAARNTVRVMTERFGADPERITAAFGPAICGKCYEVGGELMESFSGCFSRDEISQLFSPKKNGKYFLDIRKAVTIELVRMGIRAEEIHDTGICTFESKNYVSYRREGRVETVREILSGIVLTADME